MFFEKDRFCPCSHVAYRRVGDQVAIVQPLNNKLLTLNSTGSEIWEQMEDNDLGAIAEHLSRVFEVTPDQALRDARVFLEEMSQRGLVEKRHD